MLEITHLTTACHTDISLTVDSNSGISITGPSGAGKSLLLRAIADLDPHEGEIKLSGTRQFDTPAPRWRQRIGLLGADYPFWTETPGEYFNTLANHNGLHEMLDTLQLSPDILLQMVNQLSSGERQRLALIRLLLNQPACLLLDEPCSHLDPETTLSVETLIREYQKKQACPIIWVSHDASQRQRVATRHYRLDKGLLIEDRV